MKPAGKRLPRKPPAETGEFLWLVSLSDLMILLFVTFVVLFSFAYKKLKDANLINPEEFKRIVAALQNKKLPPNPIDQVQKNLNQWVSQEKLENLITIERKADAITMQIKDKLLFESGKFQIHPEGYTAIRTLAKTLEKVPDPYKIGIEGHTDDVPIHSKTIQDNWDLSSKRALAVLYALGLPEALVKRTLIMAHGDTQPLVPNRTPEGVPIPENQAKNRRVTLKIF